MIHLVAVFAVLALAATPAMAQTTPPPAAIHSGPVGSVDSMVTTRPTSPSPTKTQRHLRHRLRKARKTTHPAASPPQ